MEKRQYGTRFRRNGKRSCTLLSPNAERLGEEMKRFIGWFNTDYLIDPVLIAFIVHLWFVTIHPFDDGNGRIARALTDVKLWEADGVSQRFYSMSALIKQERREYYRILEKAQKGNSDISNFIVWFYLTKKTGIR